jgi:hypothetical protein
MLKPELQTIVDRLCEDGCTAVNQYILEIQSGHCPTSMQQLNRNDCETVLVELQSIMAVYEHKGA